MQGEAEESSSSTCCPICYDPINEGTEGSVSTMVQLDCRHSFCESCLEQYIQLSNIPKCPEQNCHFVFPTKAKNSTTPTKQHLPDSEQSSTVTISSSSKSSIDPSTLHLLDTTTKSCPHCLIRSIKEGGCSHVTCPACLKDWCFTCRNPNLSGEGLTRYCEQCRTTFLNPSGSIYWWNCWTLPFVLPITIFYIVVAGVGYILTFGCCGNWNQKRVWLWIFLPMFAVLADFGVPWGVDRMEELNEIIAGWLSSKETTNHASTSKVMTNDTDTSLPSTDAEMGLHRKYSEQAVDHAGQS